VYSLGREAPIPEEQLPVWKGYQGSAPVRIRNQASEHVQNDVYGEVILALAPIFLDERFRHLRTPEIEALMHRLIELAARSISRKDAGLWEFRDGWREHAFSSLMSWAGLDRAERMIRHGVLRPPGVDIRAEKLRAEQAVLKSVVDGSLRNGPEDTSFDASLLLAPILRFPSETLNRRSVDAIRGALELGSGSPYLYRYKRQDDFGTPKSAFLLCSFWLVQALASTGRKDEGRLLLEKVRDSANALGLFSEHYDPASRRQLGNFPQAYSHVGMIQAAFAVSPPWSDIL
jgi:GH15 family glucan-1,4-alpha-glucosidase